MIVSKSKKGQSVHTLVFVLLQFHVFCKLYILTDKWILAQKLSIVRYKVLFAKHMKLKKNEDQGVDTLPPLGIGSKAPMEGATETEFGAETKGWTI